MGTRQGRKRAGGVLRVSELGRDRAGLILRHFLILERHPWAGRSLVEAFTKAKELGIKHVSDTRRSFLAWYGAELEEEKELFGEDAWPYNIRDNRDVLETMTRYAALVGVTDRKLEINELFTESALAGEFV